MLSQAILMSLECVLIEGSDEFPDTVVAYIDKSINCIPLGK